MTHGVSEVLCKDNSVQTMHSKQQSSVQHTVRKTVGVMGSRRIFAPAFKLKVLDSYRNDMDCRGNQRATARKYGIHRRQIQKWLQCEENLRNSCAENGNIGTVSTPTTDSSAGVSKPDGTMTEATGPAVTPAAPALNLSVARLHGDGLTTQQGPPPLLPSHPPRSSAPSSPQYSLQNTTTGTGLPQRVASVGYQEYSSPTEQQHLHREHEDIVHVPEIQGYPDTQMDQDRNNYYTMNGDGQTRDSEPATVFGGRNEVKVYQTMTSYHPPHQEHRYVNDIDVNVHHHSPNHRPKNYGDIDLVDRKSYADLLPAPLVIKTEPASPDSTATSGPYEPAGSPSGPWAPLSPISHRATNGSGGSSLSVHFNSPRNLASPYLDVHVHEHAHACPPLNSEKPIPSRLHQQERESEETMGHVEEKGEQKTLEKTEYCRTVIKEEVDLGEEKTCNEREEANAPSYIDVTGELPTDSRPASPVHDREGYSLPSSPPDPASSSRSNSSWSDSEMESLDCLPGNQNSTGNLTRRRSFPLRFKLDVLDAFHRDAGVAGNQRATARKFGINRRQVQKWLGQETELRGEIALRGNSRQRLGPIQDNASTESPMDLRTMNYVSPEYSRLPRDPVLDIEYEPSSPHLYCCDAGSISSQHPPYYQLASTETEPTGSCNLSCCIDRQTTTSTTSSYQDLSLRGSHTESPSRGHCYSPRDSEFSNLPEGYEQSFPSLKRQSCALPCCLDTSSPKRFCRDDTPPQDVPLCLVKPKRTCELVTNTALIPSESGAFQSSPSTSNKDDGIFFKPYLDNPVCKPANEDAIQRSLSPIARENNNNDNNMNNNNNYCQSICNFNEGQEHNRNFQLNLRLPISWMPYPGPYTEFQHVGSTFIRYPAYPESTCNFLFNPLRPDQTRTAEDRKLVKERVIDRVIHTFRLQDTLV